MIKKQKILVLGSGFVGKPLSEYLGADISTKRLKEITKADLNTYDVVINTVAKTLIDWCELNKLETFDTNVVQALRIAQITKGKYVFFSSGCIFKSEKETDINYEDAIPNPQCFYTYTKLVAEQLILDAKPDTLVIRPRLLISEKSHPRNTIDKLLKYENVITCQESATVLEDMLKVIKKLIDENATGAYNIANSGTISPSEIMEIFGKKHNKITKDKLDELVMGKARRVSTILCSKKIPPYNNIRERIKEIKNNWK